MWTPIMITMNVSLYGSTRLVRILTILMVYIYVGIGIDIDKCIN